MALTLLTRFISFAFIVVNVIFVVIVSLLSGERDRWSVLAANNWFRDHTAGNALVYLARVFFLVMPNKKFYLAIIINIIIKFYLAIVFFRATLAFFTGFVLLMVSLVTLMLQLQEQTKLFSQSIWWSTTWLIDFEQCYDFRNKNIFFYKINTMISHMIDWFWAMLWLQEQTKLFTKSIWWSATRLIDMKINLMMNVIMIILINILNGHQ